MPLRNLALDSPASSAVWSSRRLRFMCLALAVSGVGVLLTACGFSAVELSRSAIWLSLRVTDLSSCPASPRNQLRASIESSRGLVGVNSGLSAAADFSERPVCSGGANHGTKICFQTHLPWTVVLSAAAGSPGSSTATVSFQLFNSLTKQLSTLVDQFRAFICQSFYCQSLPELLFVERYTF